MRKVTLALFLAALLAIFTTASAETSVDTIREWVSEGIGVGETITNVELDERVVSVAVDISNVKELYPGYMTDLATDRASSITDVLLDHEEFDAEWDIIYIDIEKVGYFFFTKDDIKTNEYNMRYMNVYDEDYNSRITVYGGTPAATPEPDVSETVIEALVRYRVGEAYRETDIDSITINDDLGTDTPEDYIVLVNLTWNTMNSGKTSKEMLKMYSDDLAATLYEGTPAVQEVVVFWTVPYLNNANAKRAYERKSNGMYLSDEVWAGAFN